MNESELFSNPDRPSSYAEYKAGHHGNWFYREQIDLGKGLVAIIGNKGNGKSALTLAAT